MKRGLSLKGRALQLLAQREQSAVELRRKLTLHAREARHRAKTDGGTADRVDAADTPGANEDGVAAYDQQVNEVLAWLQAHGFASDERFAESRVNARAERFGNLRILGELSRHGVALDDEAARALKASELQRALHVCFTKFGRAPDETAAQARQYRFLAGRGFSADVIRQVLRQRARGPSDAAPQTSD